MYFLFFKLHCQSKRSAAQPQTICSEVPYLFPAVIRCTSPAASRIPPAVALIRNRTILSPKAPI